MRSRALLVVILGVGVLSTSLPARPGWAEGLPPASPSSPLGTLLNPSLAAISHRYLKQALGAADFILGLQNRAGAIQDFPRAGVANTDSHMEYAILGLGAAYAATSDGRYLDGMRRGLRWLSARQRANGSWWLAYSTHRPYRPVRSAYGVSSTVSLFAYDLWLYRSLGGDPAFVDARLPAVRTGLDFLYGRMRATDGTFRSGYLRAGGGGFHKNRYRYTSDQADLILGLRAASALLGRPGYRADADALAAVLAGPRFFLAGKGRYALGVRRSGRRDRAMGILTVWPQGYVPWVIGGGDRQGRALGFLRSKAQSDGSVKAWSADPVYTLSAEDLVMATVGVTGAADAAANGARTWMSRVQRRSDGGLADSLTKPTEFCNIAGLAVVAWLGAKPALP